MLERWGVATVDDGILDVRLTRRAVVRASGIGLVTRYKRSKCGALYEYQSEGGTRVLVGRVEELLANGFRFPKAMTEQEQSEQWPVDC